MISWQIKRKMVIYYISKTWNNTLEGYINEVFYSIRNGEIMRKRITKFLLAQLILISFVFSNFGTMLKEVCTFAEQISSDGENTDKTTIITVEILIQTVR